MEQADKYDLNRCVLDDKRPHILVCFSGSVATLKVPEIVNKLKAIGSVRMLCSSKAAMHFLDRAKEYQLAQWENFLTIGGKDLIVDDVVEWSSWDKIGDPVIHIELRSWADIVLIAPASADLIAHIAYGFANNLLLSTLRAWDFSKPAILCPAMNSLMWKHPSTLASLSVIQSWGYHVVMPAVKRLACNEVGCGALAPVDEIVLAVKDSLYGREIQPSHERGTFSGVIMKLSNINLVEMLFKLGYCGLIFQSVFIQS